ncbi:MAG: inorganic phosphate transporter, partial [Candidatus Methanoperedens sp.]|nr:inorganic phosphate transporter [Candidatus Methanoperedens sp.]
THGTNDAQKTMGIITVLLVAYGSLSAFKVPLWVILAAHISISLGTFFGGWRIVKTMAQKITKLRPYQGFCAETSGGLVLASMAALGVPVSTTHVISSSIMGVGATDKLSAVRWGIARKIVGAWILTIPASAIMSFSTYLMISGIF